MSNTLLPLRCTTLNLDPTTLYQISDFLEKNFPSNRHNQVNLIFASAAIICELKTLPNLLGQMVHIGLKTQTMMRHIGQSKQGFLDVLVEMGDKWKEMPHWLKSKFSELHFAYRIHKKYRLIFEELAKKCGISGEMRISLMALFWLLLVQTKNEKANGNPLISIEVIECIINFAFTKMIFCLETSIILNSFLSHFPTAAPSSLQTHQTYQITFQQKLNFIYENRFQQKATKLSQYLKNEIFLARFLDDYSNYYCKKMKFEEGQIDQVGFLEINKNITPMTMKRKDESYGISSLINFQDEQDEEKENQQNIPLLANMQSIKESPVVMEEQSDQIQILIVPTSPLKKKPNFGMSPISMRIEKADWVKRMVSIAAQQPVIYKFQKHQLNYQQFKDETQKILMECINQFTPKVTNREFHQSELYKFFLALSDSISLSNFSQNQFRSLLCVSTEIYNFSHKALKGMFRRYCEIFEISILDGFNMIQKVKNEVKSMPNLLKDHLEELQKKIVVEEIWDCQLGFKVVCEKNQQKYKRMFQMIKAVAHERTQQLCLKIEKISENHLTKMVNLVDFILDNRPTLLHRHKLDQIIVCVIASLLRLNSSPSTPMAEKSLEEIFLHYNQLLFSFQSNKTGLFDRQGNEVDLVDYYNHVFLHEIEELIRDDSNEKSFLLTPIRTARKYKLQNGNLTPIHQKYKQRTKSLSFTPGLKRKSSQQYHKKLLGELAKSLSKDSEECQSINSDSDNSSSPTFGPLKYEKRSFSYGSCQVNSVKGMGQIQECNDEEDGQFTFNNLIHKNQNK